MRTAVFLDRDGVLNRAILRDGATGSPRRIEEFELVPQAASAVEMLKQAGLVVVVITNQPDLARGLVSRDLLDLMHDRLRRRVSVDAIYVCPHDDRDGCLCRKPKPGLILQASEQLNINPNLSFLVGDTWRDVDAGKAAGCTPLLVRSEGGATMAPSVRVVPNILAAAEFIVEEFQRRQGQEAPSG